MLLAKLSCSFHCSSSSHSLSIGVEQTWAKGFDDDEEEDEDEDEEEEDTDEAREGAPEPAPAPDDDDDGADEEEGFWARLGLLKVFGASETAFTRGLSSNTRFFMSQDRYLRLLLSSYLKL